MPNKGNFVELTDTSSSVRKPATTTNVEEEDDDLSLASQDIDNVSEYRPKKTVKDYIAEKKVAVQNFNVTEFAQTKKHQIETFSLDEFMSDKRKVVCCLFCQFKITLLTCPWESSIHTMIV